MLTKNKLKSCILKMDLFAIQSNLSTFKFYVLFFLRILFYKTCGFFFVSFFLASFDFSVSSQKSIFE